VVPSLTQLCWLEPGIMWVVLFLSTILTGWSGAWEFFLTLDTSSYPHLPLAQSRVISPRMTALASSWALEVHYIHGPPTTHLYCQKVFQNAILIMSLFSSKAFNGSLLSQDQVSMSNM
jgi:hypothetical protein